jgi:inhibitor of cysteine peptidase
MPNSILTSHDAGSTVSLNSGDTVILELEENPTTGYVWKVEELDSRILELTGEDLHAAGGGIGAGGTRKMTFKAIGAGASLLRLKCARPWEPDAPSSTFSVTIDVHA